MRLERDKKSSLKKRASSLAPQNVCFLPPDLTHSNTVGRFECSERLSPGQLGWLGAAALGSIPALALPHSQKSQKLTSLPRR